MNKYKKLMSDTVILGMGTFASKVLVFLLMPLYTSCLDPGQFNLADLISQTANLIIPIACVGVCDGLFRFALGSDADKPSVFKTGLTVLFLSSAVFLALSPLLFLIKYFNGYAWLIILYVLASNIHSAFAQYIRAGDRMKLFAFQGILNTALVIGFNLVFLLAFNMGVSGYVLSVVIADILVALFLALYAGLWRDLAAGKFSFRLMRDIVKYSVPMIPTTIFWWITNVSDRYIVTWYYGDGASGLYSAAYRIPTMLTLICTVFYEAWQFSAVKDAEEKTKSRFFGRVFGYYSSVMFVTGAGIVLFCQTFVSLLFADKYAESWVFIPVLTLASVFTALTTFMGSVYLVKKKTQLSFLTSMTGAVSNIVLNFIMIPLWGAQGAAIATALSYMAVFIIRALSVQKYVRFFVNYLRLAVNTILLALMCAVSVSHIRHWWFYCAALAALILAVNLKTLIKCIAGAAEQFIKRRIE